MKTINELIKETEEAIREFQLIYGDRKSIDEDMLTVERIKNKEE